MGASVKFLQRFRKYASFLIEFSDLERMALTPLHLQMCLFAKIDSILRSCNVPLKISIDTAGYPELEAAVSIYDCTSLTLAKYRKKRPVKIIPVQ